MSITEKKPLVIQIPGERTPNELPVSASAVGYDFVQGNYIFYSTGSDSWVTAPSNVSNSTAALDYSLVDIYYYSNNGPGPGMLSTSTGSYTIGTTFGITQKNRSIAGVRFAVDISTTREYSASLWNSAGTLLASKTVNCISGSFVYEALFDSPVVVTGSTINDTLTVGLYQTANVDYNYVAAANIPGGIANPPVYGSGYVWRNISLYSAGNARPLNNAAAERYSVEPIII